MTQGRTGRASRGKTTSTGIPVQFTNNLSLFRRALRKGFNLSEKLRRNKIRNPEVFENVVEEIQMLGNRVYRTFPKQYATTRYGKVA